MPQSNIHNQNTEKHSTKAPLRAVAVHDLSCFGRCALTVCIPTLSAMGIQAVPLPTALLSTHTGGFTDFTFLDLTGQMEAILSHWKKLELRFDAIYTGFLGSEAQFDTVERLIGDFRDGALVLVDPVMGDNGALYQTIDEKMVRRMKDLISHADVITPNITEACLLLGIPYKMPCEKETADMLLALTERGAKKAVLTGICREGEMITACFDRDSGELHEHRAPRLDLQYPGTGDIFASVLLGMLMRGGSLREASAAASDYIFTLMRASAGDSGGKSIDDNREGVYLENHIGELFAAAEECRTKHLRVKEK